MFGFQCTLAGVQHHKTAGAIGALDHTRFKAGLPDRRRLLVANHRADRQTRAQQRLVAVTEIVSAIFHVWQQTGGNIEHFEQLFVPALFVDIKQQGTRGIARVGGMHFAAGQAPQQKAVDRAECQLPGFRPAACTRHIIENPGQFAGGEIRIQQQATATAGHFLQPLRLQSSYPVRRATVLPDNRGIDRLATAAIPNQRGLTLIGNTDTGDL